MPYERSLPCFVYGFLKPGELAHGQIEDAIKDKTEDQVCGEIRVWDGLPLLSLGVQRKARGFVLYASDEERLLSRINAFEPRKQYKWEQTATQNGIDVNLLVGRQGPIAKATAIQTDTFRSGDDTVLTFGLNAARIALAKAHPVYGSEEYYFFDVQMSYMLMASVLERFLSLRYGPALPPSAKVSALGQDPNWAKAIATNSRIEDGTAVYSSDSGELEKFAFHRGNPSGSADFFYQFRCNLVHRGKGAIRDVERLSAAAYGSLEALKGLWEIYGLPWEDERWIVETANGANANR